MTIMCLNSLEQQTLKAKSCYDANIVLTGNTWGCL